MILSGLDFVFGECRCHPAKTPFADANEARDRNLPYPGRLEVMNAVDTTDHRKMYIELLKLRESGKLPAEWNPVLDDSYSRFF